MNETPASSSSLSAIQALRESIESCTPWLHVLDVVEHPYPYVKVKDTINGIVVSFSSEADSITYVAMMRQSEDSRWHLNFWLSRTSRAKLYHKEQRLLLDALTKSLPQKCIFQDSFSSTGSAGEPKFGMASFEDARCLCVTFHLVNFYALTTEKVEEL